MSPGHKRQIAATFVNRGTCTGRQACRHFGLHRSTFAYQPRDPAPWLAKLKAALRRLSYGFPEWGYAKITRLLKDEGWRVGARLVQRLRRELGLAIPLKKPRQRRQGPSTGLPRSAVVIEEWRWKYNYIRPHRSLGYITPRRFAQKENPTIQPLTQGPGYGRTTSSLRPSLDFLKHLYQHINQPCRLTNLVDHIG